MQATVRAGSRPSQAEGSWLRGGARLTPTSGRPARQRRSRPQIGTPTGVDRCSRQPRSVAQLVVGAGRAGAGRARRLAASGAGAVEVGVGLTAASGAGAVEGGVGLGAVAGAGAVGVVVAAAACAAVAAA